MYTITVGFDGSDGSVQALRWALAEAKMRGGALKILRAWTPGEFGTDVEMGQIAAKQLEEDATAVLGADPGVEVSFATQQGHAAKVLLEHAGETDMIVVGSRGLGGFAGLLLGSVSQQVSTHAAAPVVVVVRS